MTMKPRVLSVLPDFALLQALQSIQQQGADQRTDSIASQIIPARVAAGQVELSPFVEYADQQGGQKTQQQQDTWRQIEERGGITAQKGQAAKQEKMRQFVPRRGKQPNGDRLCAQIKKQAGHHAAQQQGKKFQRDIPRWRRRRAQPNNFYRMNGSHGD